MERLFDFNENALYHYSSYDKAVRILKNKTLRMSALKNMSDPRENKIRSIGQNINLERKQDEINFVDYKSINQEFNNIFLNSKIVCFTTDIPFNINEFRGFQNDKIPYKGYFFSRMWDQYGEKHQGICLEFNKEKLFKLVQSQVEFSEYLVDDKVQYTNCYREYIEEKMVNITSEAKININKFLKERHFKVHYKSIFYKKFENWSDEHEYRITYFGEENKPHFDLKYLDALTDIFLGIDFPSENIDIIKGLMKGRNISLHRISYYNDELLINDI